jgi:hypothetical protein
LVALQIKQKVLSTLKSWYVTLGLHIVNLGIHIVNGVRKPCLVRDYLIVKGGPNPGPRKYPPSLRGSQGVALRLSREGLVLILFLILPVGMRERIHRM